MTEAPLGIPGTVYLVGAGPGDPGLITLRGVQCLEQADVVLYDYLVNPAVVSHAADTARCISLGSPSAGRALTQNEINALMVEEARSGQTVVRLKGGDPSIFGRGADECEALRVAGIPFEIVPGITTGIAVAAYCEIPVTHHLDASAVAFVAGRERGSKATSALDYGALAAFPGTLILYMGVGRAEEWSTALIGRGRSPETPVAIVRWGTCPQQEMVRCTLGTVARVIAERGLTPPSVFVVGDVVARAPARSWFTARPLFGVRILVAGSSGTSEKLQNRLGTLGAEVLREPAIQITAPPDWAPVDTALDALGTYDWLVFASPNGVDYFLQRLATRGGDVRRLAAVKLAAMGSGTAERLARHSLRADVVPEQFVAESLAQELTNRADGRRFLVARASRGRQVLADALRAAGAQVDEIVVYGNVDVEVPNPKVASALADGRIDWVAVTSSSVARSLHQLYRDPLRRVRFASIGPITSATLRELGFEVAVEASPHSTDGLVAAVQAAVTDSGREAP